ncbi:hypothetical protein ACN47E_007923 [Coniothyrium glycines]
MADDDMPPRPDCEFDFRLPHGSESQDEDEQIQEQHNANHPNSREAGRHIESSDQTNVPEVVSYAEFPVGISDDEEAGEAFDRSWAGHQARKSLTNSNKSPRRNSDDVTSPRSKKPRQSLFGRPSEEDIETRQTAHATEEQDTVLQPAVSGSNIGQHMSSLNLEQEVRQDSPLERTVDPGLGFNSSVRGSLTPSPSRAPSEESVVIPPDSQPAYELRQNIERMKTFTYIDTDRSGNFDPTAEAKQKMLKLNKARAAKALQRKKKDKKCASKENVMKCIVKVRFEAFGTVRNYTNDEENWPEGWSDIDSECEREMQEYREFFRHNTPGREMQMAIEDPGGELDDLTGYPAARGCRACRKHERDCSLIHGGYYPCEECKEEKMDCEPIIPPTRKGRCKQCAEDEREFCSFEEDDQQAICDHCAEDGYICEALPPQHYRAERIRIDELIYSADRPYIACTVCRQEKKRCSLKKKSSKPPCKYCKKNNIGCTFFDIPKPDLKKKATARTKDPMEGVAPEVAKPGSDYFTAEDLDDLLMTEIEIKSRSPTPELEMEDSSGHKGALTKINTSFAHPIEFNVTGPETSDCNFCEMPVFGFIGYFEREVHVIRWHNGLGYSEVGGGYCEDKRPTRMCQSCTNNRLQVLVCPFHELQPMYDDSVTANHDTAAEDLLSVEPGTLEMQYQLQRWCSMCFSIAIVGCATAQPSVLGEEDTEIPGCGLRLCSQCESTLQEQFDGDVNLMATEMDTLPKINEEDGQADEDFSGKPRADVGFLSQDGLLMRNMGLGG